VGRLLRQLTFLSDEEIDAALAAHALKPEAKSAQLLLADTVTTMLRGRDAVSSARRSASILYGGTGIWSLPSSSSSSSSSAAAPAAAASSSGGSLPQRALLPTLRAEDFLALGTAGEIPSVSVPVSRISGASVIDVLVLIGAAKSKGEAKRLIEGGGVYWNWERVSAKEGGWAAARTAAGVAAPGEKQAAIRPVRADADLVESRAAIVSIGRKKSFVLEATMG
jgi:tyrosyl-tRNA synthetase